MLKTRVPFLDDRFYFGIFSISVTQCFQYQLIGKGNSFSLGIDRITGTYIYGYQIDWKFSDWNDIERTAKKGELSKCNIHIFYLTTCLIPIQENLIDYRYYWS